MVDHRNETVYMHSIQATSLGAILYQKFIDISVLNAEGMINNMKGLE